MLLCTICGRAFNKPALLHRHAAVHTNEKTFKCLECNQSFTQNSSLQRHIKQKHRGERHYKCTLCPQTFAQNCNLKMHILRTHYSPSNGNNYFPCQLCQCIFQQKSALKRHQTLCHKTDSQIYLPTNTDVLNDDPDILAQNVVAQLKHLQQDLNLKHHKEEIANIEHGIGEAQKNNMNKISSPLVGDIAAQTETVKERLNPQKQTHLYSVLTVQRPNDRKYYVCEFCAMEFHKSYDLIRHRRSHTKERPYQCNICTQFFPTQTKLNNHYQKHILDEKTGLFKNQHDCVGCGQKFDSVKKLDAHTMSNCFAGNVKYGCDQCEATFATKKSFMAHKHSGTDEDLKMLEHVIPEPIYLGDKDCAGTSDQQTTYKCPTCRQELPSQNELDGHKDIHKLLPRFKCEDCGKYYSTITALNGHKKVHINYKSFSCSLCPKKYFLTKSQLEQHQQHMHNEQRNYKCTYCTALFKTHAHCKSHIRTHIKHLLNGTRNLRTCTENQQYVDSEVPLPKNKPKFIALDLAIESGKTVHRNITIEPLECSVETKSYVKNKCNFCAKTFKKFSDLQRHIRTHTKEKPFECKVCGKFFTLKSTLADHLLTHDTQRTTHVCQVCGKKYASKKTLQIHLRLHTNARPFKCEHCGQTFRTSGHRLAHLRAKNSCKYS